MFMERHKLKLKVEGIDCPGCATDVESVLLQVDGIAKVNANYAQEMITVDYDGEVISEGEIMSTIKRMGLRAKRALR